jgi:hypothetical protein
MSPPVRTLLSGTAVATTAALVVIVPRIDGIDTWKIVLGVIGLALIVISGRDAPTRQ